MLRGTVTIMQFLGAVTVAALALQDARPSIMIGGREMGKRKYWPEPGDVWCDTDHSGSYKEESRRFVIQVFKKHVLFCFPGHETNETHLWTTESFVYRSSLMRKEEL